MVHGIDHHQDRNHNDIHHKQQGIDPKQRSEIGSISNLQRHGLIEDRLYDKELTNLLELTSL